MNSEWTHSSFHESSSSKSLSPHPHTELQAQISGVFKFKLCIRHILLLCVFLSPIYRGIFLTGPPSFLCISIYINFYQLDLTWHLLLIRICTDTLSITTSLEYMQTAPLKFTPSQRTKGKSRLWEICFLRIMLRTQNFTWICANNSSQIHTIAKN